MQKLIKEPLVHFLLIGLAIFLTYGWLSDEESDENKITIDDSHLAHLVSIWELQWNRPPTELELQGVLEKYIQQEVFYREALKMNLDHNDEVVKRRLAQKMEFLSDDLSALVDPPTDEKLEDFYQNNKERYQTPYRYSFRQIVFTPDKHSNPESRAKAALEKYKSGNMQDLADQGDPLAIPSHFEKTFEPQVQKELGGNMAKSLRELPLNKWSGPVQSGFGYHLVFLMEKAEPSYPEFSEIRNAVERDYAYETEAKNQQLIYETLKKNYDIEITADLNEQVLDKLQANLIEP